ncbi:MAG: hypothetical protein VX569_10955 [Pseudomonadota bacterium]|nr:hypothetical protein [Pseudomonadota bacterium]
MISLPADWIHRRFGDVAALIAPLLSPEDYFEAARLTAVRDYTIGILPFGYAAETVMDPSNVRFPTNWDDVFFNYHERWVPIDGGRRFALERAYLHLYLSSLDDLQAASLHCDPMLEKSEVNYRYKRGPHLHIAGAIPDISRAHVSVCVADTARGGNNLGSLTSTFKAGLRLLIDELIPSYSRHLQQDAA